MDDQAVLMRMDWWALVWSREVSRRSFHTVLVAWVLGDAFLYVSSVGSAGCGLRTLRCRDPGRHADSTGGVDSRRNRDASTEFAGLSGLPCAVDSIRTARGISSGYCASVFSIDRNSVAPTGLASVTFDPTVGTGGIGEVAAERILHNNAPSPSISKHSYILIMRSPTSEKIIIEGIICESDRFQANRGLGAPLGGALFWRRSSLALRGEVW